MYDILIRRANVDGRITDIGISDGTVTAMAETLSGPAKLEFDVTGRVAVSGLVDCHLHMDKALLNERAAYVDGDGGAKGALTREKKAKFTVEDITERAERIIKREIRSGAIAVRTNVDVDAIVKLKGVEAMLALREKYRGILDIQVAAFSQEGIFSDGETERLLPESLEMGAYLIGGHTITCGEGERHIDYILQLAKRYGVDADFHLDESGKRENYLLPYTVDKALKMGLEGRVNAIHMCTLAALTPEERKRAIELLSEAGFTATIAPTAISTRRIAPVKELIGGGITVGLGSDNIRDFFNPLGSGDVKQVALLLSYIQRFFTDEEVDSVWEMLTYGGARLLGLKEYGISESAAANVTIFGAATPREVLAYQAQPTLIVRSGKVIEQ